MVTHRVILAVQMHVIKGMLLRQDMTYSCISLSKVYFCSSTNTLTRTSRHCFLSFSVNAALISGLEYWTTIASVKRREKYSSYFFHLPLFLTQRRHNYHHGRQTSQTTLEPTTRHEGRPMAILSIAQCLIRDGSRSLFLCSSCNDRWKRKSKKNLNVKGNVSLQKLNGY